MNKYITVAAFFAAGTALASAATTLRYQASTDASAGADLLSISQWGYFWNLQDASGTTRPDGQAGNAYAGVNNANYTAITTAGNSDFTLTLSSTGTVSLSLNEAAYFDQVLPGTNTPSSYSFDFGTDGSITTAQNINFGQGVSSISFSVSLTDLQLDTLSSGGVVTRTLLTGNSNYGIWNFSDAGTKSLTISNLDGYTFAGVVSSADALSDGQYGLIYSGLGITDEEDAADTISFAVKASAIPEPSAFGLLAGAGALTLVASRRRRRAK